MALRADLLARVETGKDEGTNTLSPAVVAPTEDADIHEGAYTCLSEQADELQDWSTNRLNRLADSIASLDLQSSSLLQDQAKLHAQLDEQDRRIRSIKFEFLQQVIDLEHRVTGRIDAAKHDILDSKGSCSGPAPFGPHVSDQAMRHRHDEDISRQVEQISVRIGDDHAAWALKFQSLESQVNELHRSATHCAADAVQSCEEVVATTCRRDDQLQLQIVELRNWMEGRFDKARQEVEERVQTLTQHASRQAECHLSEVERLASTNLHRVQVDIDASLQDLRVQMDCLQQRLSVAEQGAKELSVSTEVHVKETGAAMRDALVTLRDRELRSHAEAMGRLQLVTGSLASGLLRLAQVCGLLKGPVQPPFTGSRKLNASDLLDFELSGTPLEQRISEAWNCVCDGKESLLELAVSRAEQASSRLLRIEVSDLSARIDRGCNDAAKREVAMMNLLPPLEVSTGNTFDIKRSPRLNSLGWSAASRHAAIDPLRKGQNL